MISLIVIPDAIKQISGHSRQQRLAMGLTQTGLSERSGVKLATLRKFEQQGVISLESYLKIQMVLGTLTAIVDAAAPKLSEFSSIDEVLKPERPEPRKRGWRQ